MQISFWVKLFTALHYDDVQHFMWGFLQIARPDVKADVAVMKRHQRLNQILISFFYLHYIREIGKVVYKKLCHAIRLRNLMGGVHTAYIPEGFEFYIGNKVRYMFIY